MDYLNIVQPKKRIIINTQKANNKKDGGKNMGYMTRTNYLRLKKGLRTLRYITTSLLLVELVVVSGMCIGAMLCN